MSEIKHKYTKEIVCPYCGYEFSDSWDYSSDLEDIGLIDCENCDKSFYANRIVTINYSTEKANYGTCKKCGAENVVIESSTSSYGSYTDLCIECGDKESTYMFRKSLGE